MKTTFGNNGQMNSGARSSFHPIHPKAVLLASLTLLWVAACSARAQSAPGTALQFDGVNDEATTSYASVWRVFPLTLTAWVKTTQTVAYAQIAGNYAVNSANGYAIGLRNGRLDAWYFRDGANYVWIGEGGLDGGFLADGTWHHIAFVVSPSAGALYVDGGLVRLRGWTGTAGATTSADVFRIGRYGASLDGYFVGEIDQVTLWKAALSVSDVPNRYRLEFTGNEPDLYASWNFNEGTGSLARPVVSPSIFEDLATLQGGPAWVVSTAPIGPAPIATTSPVSNVPGSGATLRGIANPRGVTAGAFFQWGTTPLYGGTTPLVLIGSGTNDVQVSASISGLASNTVYHCRIVVTNAFGRIEGADVTFNTSTPFTLMAELDGAALGNPAWGDYDNDGDLDLLVRVRSGTNENLSDAYILRNDGPGTWTKELLLANQRQIYSLPAPSWIDFDRDGDLDAFVPESLYDNAASRIWVNSGGTFTPVNVGLPPFTEDGAAQWGDFDNDGDPDVLIVGSFTGLFQNSGGTFTNLRFESDRILNTSFQSINWGDYDSDGDLDLVTTGLGNGFNSRIWRNASGALSDIVAGVPFVDLAIAIWADYDNDLDLDLLVVGETNSPSQTNLSLLLRNDGAGGFVNSGVALPGPKYPSASWGDYDNDGDLDLLLGGGTTFPAGVSTLFRNDGGTFVDAGANLPGYSYPGYAWGDFDGDGRLDFVMAGGRGLHPLLIYRSVAASNTPPSMPTGLTATVRGSRVDLSWNAASDAQSPTNALSYNVRVGTSPGSQNVMTADANLTTGVRRLIGTGNAQKGTSHFLVLPPGTYYWSVQAVDSRYTGGAFAAEQSFTISTPICGPGQALYLDSEDDDFLQGPFNTNLNHYPITITAWINTTRISPQHDGIVSKYANGSGDGYSMTLYQGRIRAWYFRNLSSYVYPGDPGFDGGFVADGRWHHVAFTVDATGGKLYVDGVRTGSLAWTGSPGAPSTSAPLQIARYDNYQFWFTGNIDEVTVWSHALTPLEVTELGMRRPTGAEGGLSAYWNFNSGTTDVTGHGNNLVAPNGMLFAPSTAPVCAPLVRTFPMVYPDWGANGAVLRGLVHPQGSSGMAWFEYGTTTNYGNTTDPAGFAGTTEWIPRAATIANLTPNTTYHYRIVAFNEFGQSRGTNVTFTTPAYFAPSYYETTFVPLNYGDVAWADFDGHDRVDLLLTGAYGDTPQTDLYGGEYLDFASFGYRFWSDTPGLQSGAVAPGDFDNDGDIDFFASGVAGPGDIRSLLRRNTISSFPWTFDNVSNNIPPMAEGGAVWGDIDNDGDLDLAVSGGDGVSRYCRIYRNDAGVLNIFVADLPSQVHGSLAWGDYDNDGDLDLLAVGSGTNAVYSKIYRNDNTVFTDSGVVLPPVWFGGAQWFDYDRDGDLDIAMTGYHPLANVPLTRIYRNDGGGTFSFTVDLTGLYSGKLAWGDFDNDGWPDLIVCGKTSISDGTALTKLWRNNLGGSGSAFVEVQATLPNVVQGSLAWGDPDGNGTLDVALSGRTPSDEIISVVRWNQSFQNSPPTAPTALAFIEQSNRVVLSWTTATDNESPSIALTYNLRIGTTPGGSQIMSPQSNPLTGARRVVAMGNAQHGTNAWLRLPPGTYYWSVQAVDAGFAGSPFAPEQSFTIAAPALSIHRTSTNSVVISWPSPSIGFVIQQSDDLNPLNWTAPQETVTDNGTIKYLIVNPPTGNRFYRLFKP